MNERIYDGINERIKELRIALDLSQKEFGDKIGVTTSTISGYESGRRTPNESVIKSMCREFNASIAFLKEGLGDMFTNLPETMLDEIADIYHLNDQMKNLIKTMLELDKNEQDVLINILEKTFIQKGE